MEDQSNPHAEHFQVDMSGIYHEDSTGEEPDIHLHGVEGNLLDIYPSRSNSSLSVNAPELSTRAPYLEGVSNNIHTPSSVADDHSIPRADSTELLHYQREESVTEGNAVPVSLREFLGAGPSTQRSSLSPATRSTASGLNSDEVSLVQSREALGYPQEAVWRGLEPGSTAIQSVRAPRQPPSRTNPHYVRSGGDDYSSSSDISGGSPLLSHTSSSQIRRSQRASPQPPPRPDFVIPRWQPDAEVTFCPICRTQFSKISCLDCFAQILIVLIGFFVRKHHCRYALLSCAVFLRNVVVL